MPKNHATPLYIIEIESEPIAPERLAELDRTSQSGVITQHQLMIHYRITPRNTIVCGVRQAQHGQTYPLPGPASCTTRTSPASARTPRSTRHRRRC
ncbi:hypothetical protein [Rothia halotolerans]|uniref:hypothetical protein n=1 Tax=Rothia halotolerans TaxID=405770 RepID=UPI00192DEF4B|nr:hypothetical protein [Rothia halotolerans]